jgi:hypothetical protein
MTEKLSLLEMRGSFSSGGIFLGFLMPLLG